MSVKVSIDLTYDENNKEVFSLNGEDFNIKNLEEAVKFYINYQYAIDSTNVELGITNEDCNISGCVRCQYQVIKNFHDFVKNNNLVDHYKSNYSFKEFFDTLLSVVEYGNWGSSQFCWGRVVEYASAVEQAIKIGYEIVPLWDSPAGVYLSSYHWDDLEEKELNDENFKKALNLFKKLFKNDVKDWYSHEFSCVGIYEKV
jgi:tetratricopeptide (TPR) repeat protein